ncbi:MAG: aspartyl/glutamyl-tRNA(Asn/Gln) amidotransferase subunit C [Candidatus Omnitrophica bacterium 4484_213]|nr:MAG: aspartyl/glutamyl-tRNA(Asn/Gln) amidotransferase subunit C [Candidatus Omnitrophica bacterium 4484_213]
MSLKTDDINHIEELARIKLREDEKKEIAGQLSKILDYVNKLKDLRTDDVKIGSLFGKGRKQNVFREDKVKKSLPPQEVLKNAPEREGNFFKVPKIIDND